MSEIKSRACLGLVPLALSISIPLWGTAAPAWGAEKKAAIIEVLLPADAQLEVDGYQTRTRGETRRFETPPVEPGSTYAYSIKATWRGHTIARTIRLRVERVTTVDLRQELQAMLSPTIAPPTPLGSFSLLVPPAMTLNAGQRAVLPLRVKRFHFPGSIRITFARLPKGITMENVALDKDHTEASANVIAAADVPRGTHEINVLASSGSSKDAATMTITVIRPETKSERRPQIKLVPEPETRTESKLAAKPESKPKTIPEPRREVRSSRSMLQMALPRAVELGAGRTTFVEVQVKTADGSPLPSEPKITLATAPDVPLRSAPWTRSAFESRSPVSTTGFAVSAQPDAPPGEHDIQVVATIGANTVKRRLKVAIQSSPARMGPAAKPAPVLRVESPANVVLRPGQTQYVEVKVTTESNEGLPVEPVVTLASPADDLVTCVPWTASGFKNSPSLYTVGFALKAAPDARAGERKVMVRIVAGSAKDERSVQVVVQLPERKSELEARPAAALQLVLPDRIELVAGRTEHIELRVRTADGSPLPDKPSVTVEALGADLRTTPWTASRFEAEQNVSTAGFAVTAAPEAAAGERDLKVAAVAGSSHVERTFKVAIKTPAPKRAAAP